MGAHMPGQMAGCNERLLTNTARMRLLTGVHPHVISQIAGLSERLVTNITMMRLLTSVDPHVIGQGA